MFHEGWRSGQYSRSNQTQNLTRYVNSIARALRGVAGVVGGKRGHAGDCADEASRAASTKTCRGAATVGRDACEHRVTRRGCAARRM